MNIYLGWDVGGWNCDRNRESRDALCALADSGNRPALIGSPWRGNLREILCSYQPIRGMLDAVGVNAVAEQITVAIDTPLTWPPAATALLTRGERVSVPPTASHNPYLFRRTEILLAKQGKQALSPIRDMIGSQSLKGLHFLSAAGLRPIDVGVWQNHGTPRVTAIECYPSPCRQSSAVQRALQGVRVATENEDIRDALCAASIAWLFANDREALLAAPTDFARDEGWIWVTRDAFPTGTAI